MFFLRALSDERALALLRERAAASLTYGDVGITRTALDEAPAGFALDRYGAELGDPLDHARARS